MIDNIEIGTSDFDTLIGSAEGSGISVEPVPVYFDRLPEREGWQRVNKAIMDYNGVVMCYYVDPDKAKGLPRWVRGCNSMNKPHPTILKMHPEVVETEKVECITIKKFYRDYNIDQVGFMKIDTEGFDSRIVEDMLYWSLPMPEKLQFEWNSLSDDKKMFALCGRLKKIYKSVQKREFNVVCW